MLRLWRESCAFRGCVVALAVILLVIVAPWLYLDWRTQRDMEAAFERLAQSGYPTSLADLAPGPVPDEQNAAALYQKVFRLDFDNPGYSDDLLSSTPGAQAVYDYLSGDVGPATVRPVLTSIQVEHALDLLREGAHRPAAVFPIDWSEHARILFPQYARYREATRWLSARALLDAHLGDMDAAVDRIETALRMSRHVDDDPILIGTLVAIAMQAIAMDGAERALSEGPAPSPQAAQRLQEVARSIDNDEALNRALRGEAAMRIDLMREVALEPDTAREMFSNVDSGDPWDRVLSLYHLRIMRPVRNADVIACLEETEDQIRVAQGLTRLRQPPSAKMPGLLGKLGVPGTLPLVRMVGMPTWDRARQKTEFAQQHVDLLDVALDLKLHKATHGEYPPTGADLEAALGRRLPEDRYTNKPLKYRREGDGFVLYSVGPDGDDDGGLDRGDPGFDYYDNLDVTWKAAR